MTKTKEMTTTETTTEAFDEIGDILDECQGMFKKFNLLLELAIEDYLINKEVKNPDNTLAIVNDLADCLDNAVTLSRQLVKEI